MDREPERNPSSSRSSSPPSSPHTPPRRDFPENEQSPNNLENSSSSQKYAEVGDPDEIEKSAQLMESKVVKFDQPSAPPVPKQIEKVFETAYDQRKYLNQADFGEYTKKRNLYFQKHCQTLQSIVYQLNSKIKETTTFIPYLIKHFHQVSESHRHYIESCRKIEVFKFLNEDQEKKESQKRHEWFPGVMKGIKMLMSWKEETSNKHRNMDQHVTGEVIPGLEKSLHAYTKSLNAALKGIEKQKDLYKDIQNTVQKKLGRVNKMFQNHAEKKDWLSYELATFQLFSQSRRQLISFGTLVGNYWHEIINHEKMLAGSIQKIIQQLLQHYRSINSTSKEFQEYVRYWMTLKVETDVDVKFKVSNVLVLSSLDFLRSTLKIKSIIREQFTLSDFETFTKLDVQKDIFGDKQGILSSLVVKRFTVQRQGQENTHNSITVFSTIDHYLVFFDQSNPDKINKMEIKRLLNTRKSDHAVNVNQKIERFIMDSWNRETIYFSSADQAEEFMFHTESNQEMKKSYLK